MSKVMTDIEGFINFDKFNKIVNLAIHYLIQVALLGPYKRGVKA